MFRTTLSPQRYAIDKVEDARKQLEEAVLPGARYSAMAQDFLDFHGGEGEGP